MEECVDEILQDITDYISYRKFYTCRPQNVAYRIAAADTVLSKWWYMLAVVHTLYNQTPLVSRQCG